MNWMSLPCRASEGKECEEELITWGCVRRWNEGDDAILKLETARAPGGNPRFPTTAW